MGDSRLKPSEASFSVVLQTSILPTFVGSDVISGVVVDRTGLKVPVQFVDSRSNRSSDKPLPHFVTNDNDGNDNDDAGVRR